MVWVRCPLMGVFWIIQLWTHQRLFNDYGYGLHWLWTTLGLYICYLYCIRRVYFQYQTMLGSNMPTHSKLLQSQFANHMFLWLAPTCITSIFLFLWNPKIASCSIYTQCTPFVESNLQMTLATVSHGSQCPNNAAPGHLTNDNTYTIQKNSKS